MNIILIIGIVFLVLWIAGIGTRTTLNGLVHIALIIALILIIAWMLRAIFHVY